VSGAPLTSRSPPETPDRTRGPAGAPTTRRGRIEGSWSWSLGVGLSPSSRVLLPRLCVAHSNHTTACRDSFAAMLSHVTYAKKEQASAKIAPNTPAGNVQKYDGVLKYPRWPRPSCRKTAPRNRALPLTSHVSGFFRENCEFLHTRMVRFYIGPLLLP